MSDENLLRDVLERIDRAADWLGMKDLIREGFETARVQLGDHGVLLELYRKEFPTFVQGPWWDATSERGFGQFVLREFGGYELRMIHLDSEPDAMKTYDISPNEEGLQVVVNLLIGYLGCG